MERAIIKPTKGLKSINLKEIYTYRELLYFLIWKDIKVKYKQTIFGIGWAILQPFFMMIIFTLFFGKFAKIPSDNIPYPIFSYTGLIIWTYFANSLTFAVDSIVKHQNVVTKIYFPKILLPLSSILSNLVDFFISFIILILFMFFFRITPSYRIFYFPLFLLITIITAFSVSLYLSALNVYYRDVKYIMNFLIQVWFFLTPITYPISIVPERFRLIYNLNPMVGVIEGMRWCLIGKEIGSLNMMIFSLFIIFILFIYGLYFFKNMEKSFADVI
ncbi:MAG: ABC transporter permease [Candidatus Omnitrophica bacterium]|nr:ABC transporter permease [Candidatus Omnitrophota bacterium]MCM8803498.1 ABC transporter permease [Candidatus Omnitrophota bacterium]